MGEIHNQDAKKILEITLNEWGGEQKHCDENQKDIQNLPFFNFCN